MAADKRRAGEGRCEISTKIASLYATIGADTTGLEKGLKQTKDGLTSTGKATRGFADDMKGFAASAGIAAAALTGVVVAGKQIYDFARAGAQVEFTSIKFDRLAQSIGTTSYALETDLREATHGTLSQMDLMATATDLVGLGLVKTKDEAVRLAKVVSGLGMDMNQLVLTLTNQTTMRFDQLGVSVAGFDDKVKELEKSGMSASDAFQEAFLQQAEAQLLKVGNAADTSLGSFMRLEASAKNLTDRMKELAAIAATPVIEALLRQSDAVDTTRSAVELYNERLAQNGQKLILSRAQYNMNKDAIDDFAYSQQYASGMAEYAARMLDAESEAAGTNAAALMTAEEAAKAKADADAAMTSANKSFLSTVMDVSSAQDKYNSGMAEAKALLDAHKIKTAEYNQKVKELQDTYNEASNQIIADLLLMKMTADGVFDDSEMSSYLSTLEKLGLITGEAANTAREYLGVATSLSDTQQRLADESAVAAQKGKELGVMYERMNKQAGKAAEGIDTTNDSANNFADDGAKAAIGATHDFIVGLNQLSGASVDTYIDVWVREHGKVPTGMGGTQGNGSSVLAGTGTANRATGGPLNTSGYTIVGDTAGGWSPYAEVITPEGQVIPHSEAQKMKDKGLLDGARRALFGLEDFIPSGTPATPVSSPPTFSGASKYKNSAVKASSAGGASMSASISGAMAADAMLLPMAGALNSQGAQATMQAAQAAQATQAAMESNKLLTNINNNILALLNKTATANDIAKGSYEGASKFS
jgi:hypothetical protein